MSRRPDAPYDHRFPGEIISHAAWLCHVFSLSLRDVELLLAERDMIMSYGTIRRWCFKLSQGLAAKRRRERQMQRFRSSDQAQHLLSAHGISYDHFR